MGNPLQVVIDYLQPLGLLWLGYGGMLLVQYGRCGSRKASGQLTQSSSGFVLALFDVRRTTSSQSLVGEELGGRFLRQTLVDRITDRDGKK